MARPKIDTATFTRERASSTSSTVPLNDANGPSDTRTCSPTSNDTDGFGRSDTREKLRRFFEVDRNYVAVAALKALADMELVPRKKVTEAIKKYGVDPEKPNPVAV